MSNNFAYITTGGQALPIGQGTTAFGQFTTTLVNGLNSNIQTGGLTSLRVAGPSAAFSLGGLALPAGSFPAAGQILSVVVPVTQPVTIVHEDLSSTAANRIDAQSNGANVTLPPGKPVTLTFIYNGTTSRWELASIGATRPHVFDVRDYGAKGDGSTNDYAAISAAFSACATAGGGQVYFHPTGFAYVCNGTVTVSQNTTVTGAIGQGQNLTSGSVVKFLGTGSCFSLSSSAYDINFRDMQIQGGDNLAGPLIYMPSGVASNIALRDLRLFPGNPALPAISFGTYASPIQLQPCVIERVNIAAPNAMAAPLLAAYGTAGGLSNTTLRNCLFTGPPVGVGTSATAEHVHIESTDTNIATNIAIDGCLFETPLAGAIKLMGVRNSRIVNCWMGDLAPSFPTAPMISIVRSTAGGSPPSVNITIDNLQADSGGPGAATVFMGPLTPDDQDVLIINSSIPWVQNVSTANVTGTANVVASNVTVNFSAVQTLPAGTQIAFGSQPTAQYTLLNPIASSNVGTLTTAYSGTSNGATSAIQSAGPNQGFLPIEFRGSAYGGYTGDQPTGMLAGSLNRAWAYAAAPETLTLANGLNSNVTGTGNLRGAYRVTGPTGAFSIDGIVSGPGSLGLWASEPIDGVELTIYNPTVQTMTIVASGSSASSAQNQIVTGAAGNVAIPGPGSARFKYDQTSLKWILQGPPAGIGANDTILVTNHLANNSLWIVPAGDVKYASNSFTVAGLQGNPVNNASPANNQVLQWNGSSWLPVTPVTLKTVNLIKTSNQNVTSSNLVNETALVVPMAATDNVTATWTLFVPSPARGGIQTAITIPGSATLLAITEAVSSNVTSIQSVTSNGSPMAFSNTVFQGGLVRVVASVLGDGSTAGNITLQFAQQTSNSNGTVIQAGSSVTAIKQ